MSGDKQCAFCQMGADKPRWAVRPKGSEAIFVIKPFGAVNPGHRLFIPDAHLTSADEEPEITGVLFWEAAKWAKGKGVPFNLVVNSGHVAGQRTDHLHIHYVPREAGDGLGYRWERV